jgi:hypothetical protein
MTLSDIITSGDLAGYEPRPPRDGPGMEIDAGVCARAACSACGHRGLAYRPFTRREPRTYRAFGVCPSCGTAEEF